MLKIHGAYRPQQSIALSSDLYKKNVSLPVPMNPEILGLLLNNILIG